MGKENCGKTKARKTYEKNDSWRLGIWSNRWWASSNCPLITHNLKKGLRRMTTKLGFPMFLHAIRDALTLGCFTPNPTRFRDGAQPESRSRTVIFVLSHGARFHHQISFDFVTKDIAYDHQPKSCHQAFELWVISDELMSDIWRKLLRRSEIWWDSDFVALWGVFFLCLV